MIPDVSCITSFSSHLIDSMSSLSSSLALSANFQAGGWGIAFSASFGFKMAASEISTNKFKYIISQAQCEYYYMQLLEKDPPPFHPYFMAWVRELNNTDDDDRYIAFIDTFGTHYPIEMDLGASFTFEYKMSSSAYESQSEMALSASAALSGSAFGFSAGGGVEMSSEMKSAMSQFQESVTTSTITVGAAPPANGDAMTWASSVQNDPLPVKFKLNSIEDIFTSDFMAKEGRDVNYFRIRGNIVRVKNKYCQMLKLRGLVDDCSSALSGLMLEDTAFHGTFVLETASSIGNCLEVCSKRTTCVAAHFCVTCNSNFHPSLAGQCSMFSADSITEAVSDKNWGSVIRLDNLKTLLQIKNTAINGIERSYANISSVTTAKQCFDHCMNDHYCVAFSFNTSPDVQRCTLYAERYMSLAARSGTSACILSPTAKGIFKTGGSPKFFLQGSEWVGPECTSQTDCDALNATCSGGVCKCDLSGKTTPDHQACVSS